MSGSRRPDLCSSIAGGGYVFAVLLALAGWGCAGSRSPQPDPSTVPEPVEIPSLSELPVWASDPSAHPDFAPPAWLGASGTNSTSADSADLAAITALFQETGTRILQARGRARTAHPFLELDGEFSAMVDSALGGQSDLARLIRRFTEVDSSSRVRTRDGYWSFARLDRTNLALEGKRRAAAFERRSADAGEIALNHGAQDNWFGFTRWSRTALRREAERVASLIVVDALGERVGRNAFQKPGGLNPLGTMARQLSANHGWTLQIEFEWDGVPGSGQIQPRIKQQLMRYLLDRDFQASLGIGCPRRARPSRVSAPPVPDPATLEGAESEDEEEPDGPPPPHHVLEIDVRGTSERTALASWDAEVDWTLQARTCGVGVMVKPRPITQMIGQHDRDPDAAVLRALDWDRLYVDLERSFREADITPPMEFLEDR